MLDIITLSKIAQYFSNEIESEGLHLKLSVDFLELEKVTKKNKMSVTPHFSTVENTFQEGEAFWLGVYYDCDCVGTIACKKQKLGKEPLSNYIQRYWRQVYTRNSTDKIKFRNKQKRALKVISGTLVYCGEYRLLPSYQKRGIGTSLAALTKVLTWLNWPETEALYIFTEDSSVSAGLLKAIQMPLQIENAINWKSVPSQAEPDYWIAVLGRDYFLDWIDDQERHLKTIALRE